MRNLQKYSFILLCLLISLPSWANGHKGKFERVTEATHSISSDGKVELKNKYGKVDIQTWDKNQVELTVVITVVAKNEDKANETFDRISIDMTNTEDYFHAKTEIGENSKAWWAWWNESSNEFSIDYTVRMPRGCELVVTNKYGDVYLDELSNDLNLEVKYGDFNIGNILGNTKVNLGYGNGEISSVKDMDAEVKYSKLICNQMKNADLETKYSKVFITEASALEVESKYDQYSITSARSIVNEGKYDHWDIGTVNNFEIDTKYTDVDIDELINSATTKMTYGVLKIDELRSGFSHLHGSGKYASFVIKGLQNANYDLSTSYGSIHLPSGHKNSYEMDDDNDKKKKGMIGSGGGEIIITTRYGKIEIK